MASKDFDDEPLDLNAMKAIEDAVASTEKEIFAEAMGKGDGEPLDETGDRSLEEVEASPNGEEDETRDADGSEEHTELEAKDGKDEQPRAEDGKFAAKDEAKPAVAEKAAPVKEPTVAELIAAREQDRREFEARMAAIEARTAPLPPQQQRAEPIQQPQKQWPDQFIDPDAYTNWLIAEMDARETRIRAETSLRYASQKYPEAFPKAYAEFGKLNPLDPQQQQIGRSIATAGDPGEAMVAWYRQNETLRRVGSDPEAYEARVKEEARQALAKDPEFRKTLLAELQAEASTGDGGKPRLITKLPPSLNGSSGSNSARLADPELLDGSERSIFEHAFRN